jgi:integrase
LAEHLADYAEAMKAKGDTPQHAKHTLGRLRAVFVGCQFGYWADVEVGRVSAWLNSLRRDTLAVKLPADEWFKLADVCRLLGVSRAAVAAGIKRLHLAAVGNGKARCYPRATLEALAQAQGKGHGPQTINHYVRVVRAFFRWLVKAKRATTPPLDSLELLNAAVEIRHARRELTADELRRLFDAARTSQRTFRGLTGQDRWTLYLCATGTGFRASALASLKPADFDWAASTVTLATRLNKSRKLKVQPLPPDIAATLQAYLMAKPLRERIWAGTWASEGKAAEMLRIDCARCKSWPGTRRRC